MPALGELFKGLNLDRWRNESANGFTDEMMAVNRVLNHPYANDTQRREALEPWLQRHQSCIFGRLAAAQGAMDFCFLTHDDLLDGDDGIRKKIREAKIFWKHRALRGEAKHGFMIVFCDNKVALANPDEALYRFALHLQELAGWSGRPHINDNHIVDEWLYLRHPETKKILKFTFSVDFFAAAGDRRWWHDHRAPGGIAFTANSLGHMAKQQEWYGRRTDRTEWALRTAMNTIDNAATKDSAQRHIPYAPATYLLRNRPDMRPYTWTAASKPSDLERLHGADCGTYGGYLHTDHAVREEFFRADVEPQYRERAYMMDFAYIFDPSNPDFAPFMAGVEASDEEVRRNIGRIEDLNFIAASKPRPRRAGRLRLETAEGVSRRVGAFLPAASLAREGGCARQPASRCPCPHSVLLGEGQPPDRSGTPNTEGGDVPPVATAGHTLPTAPATGTKNRKKCVPIRPGAAAKGKESARDAFRRQRSPGRAAGIRPRGR
jgi:hypothetical protein